MADSGDVRRGERLAIIRGAIVATACFAGAWTAATLVNPIAPAAPTPSGRFEIVGSDPLLHRGMNAALAAHGAYVYVGSRTDGTHPDAGILVVDVSDPAHPEVVSEIGRPDAANPGETTRELRVWPNRDLLVVLSFECNEAGHLCPSGPAAGVEPTVRFFDIRGALAANPKLVATYKVPDNPHEFFLWEDPKRPGRALLYITTPYSGTGEEIDRDEPHLLVTDISRARRGRFRELVRWSPASSSKWAEAGLHSLSLSRDGRRAYLADLEGGFMVADTSDLARAKARPRIRQLTPPGSSVHHEIPGAHSAIRLPGRPYALITDEVYGRALGLGPAIGYKVLKGCPWGWARLIDVADPAHPRIVGEHKVAPWNFAEHCGEVPWAHNEGASFSSHNPTATPHLALVTWHSAGLRAVALRDPAHPVAAAEFTPQPLDAVVTEDPALSAGGTVRTLFWSYPVVKDGLVYVVDIRNGLYILRYTGPYATELRCRSLIEGNSNVGDPVPRCGVRVRLVQRCTKRGPGRVTVVGRDASRVRQMRLRRDGPTLIAVLVLDDGTPIRLSTRIRRCDR